MFKLYENYCLLYVFVAVIEMFNELMLTEMLLLISSSKTLNKSLVQLQLNLITHSLRT